MNKVKVFAACLFAAMATIFVSCDTTEDGGEKKPVLTPSVTTIEADGEATVAFTVTYDGADVTAEATIQNVTEGLDLEGNEFSTTEAGTYEFTATYSGAISDAVTVEAVSVSADLVLTVTSASTEEGDDTSTATIINDGVDAATFTVTYQGEDVTAEATITNISASEQLKKGVNTFTSSTSGTYEFRAGYDGEMSNAVTVSVVIKELNPVVVTASKPIVASGETVTFTVMNGTEDVSSSAEIVNLGTDGSGDETLADNTFSSSTAGVYKFVAKVTVGDETVTSDAINVAVGDAAFYNYAVMHRHTGTWCNPCGQLHKTLDQAFEANDGQLHQELLEVAAHSGDVFAVADYNTLSAYLPANGSYPNTYFNFDKNTAISGAFAWATGQKIVDEYREGGTTIGIAASSVLDPASRNADINVRIFPKEAGEYYISVVLVEDGLVAAQAGILGNSNFDGIFRAIVTDSFTGDSLGQCSANTEIEWNGSVNLGSYSDNCRLVITVNTMTDGVCKMIAATDCDINGVKDYRFM